MVIFDDSIDSVLKNSLFKGLDRSCFKKYFNYKNFYIAKEGEIIYSNDDESLFLYLIIQGEVKIKLTGIKKFIDRYLFDYFGEIEILKSTKRISSALAMKDTLIYKIDSKVLMELCLSNSRIKGNLENKYTGDDEELEKEKLSEEMILPLPVLDDQSVIEELIMSNEIINNKLNTELSEEELDFILMKQKSQKQFKIVMKQVGKINGDEKLKTEILQDSSDSSEWQIVSE